MNENGDHAHIYLSYYGSQLRLGCSSPGGEFQNRAKVKEPSSGIIRVSTKLFEDTGHRFFSVAALSSYLIDVIYIMGPSWPRG